MSQDGKKALSLPVSLLCIAMLIAGYGIGCTVLGVDLKVMTVLIISVLIVIAKAHGYTFGEIMGEWTAKVKSTAPVFLILFGIGALIASFMLAGTAPVLVSWMTHLISQKYILVISFLLTCALSYAIGSSFATIGTIGIIVFTAAIVQGIPAGLAAAAVITGSNFGGYLSPFNDSKTAAAAFYKMNVMDFLAPLTLPSLIGVALTSVIYIVVGLQYSGGNTAASMAMIEEFRASVALFFNGNPLVVIPLVLALVLAFMKVDIIINLFASSFVGLILALFVQGFNLKACLNALYNGFKAANFFPDQEIPSMLTTLTDRGGMSSMGSSIIFVLLILMMGSIMIKIGAFRFITEFSVFKNSSNFGILNIATIFVCAVVAISTTESYPTILISKDMFSDTYARNGYDPSCIGRASIVTTVWLTNWLPWTFCATYFAGVCNVGVWEWLPHAYFFFITFVVSIVLAFVGVGKVKLRENYETEEAK